MCRYWTSALAWLCVWMMSCATAEPPGPPSLDRSTVAAQQSEAPVGGSARVTVEIVVRDARGTPLPDLLVMLKPAGGTADSSALSIAQPEATDASGMTTGSIGSNSAGTVAINAWVESQAVGSVGLVFTPGPVSRLVIEAPTTATAGAAFAVTVNPLDAWDNPVESTEKITLEAGTDAELAGTLSAKIVDNIAVFSNIAIETAGIHSLRARHGDVVGVTTSSIEVAAAPPSRLLVAPTGDVHAGLTFQLQVNVADPYGNLIQSGDGAIEVTQTNGPEPSLLVTPAGDLVDGAAALTATMSVAGDGFVLSAAGDGLTGESEPFKVGPLSRSPSRWGL